MARDRYDPGPNRALRSKLLRDPSTENSKSVTPTYKAGPSRKPRPSRPSASASASASPAAAKSPPANSRKRKAPSASPPMSHGTETQFAPDDDDDLWTAEEIIDERGPRGARQYLVKWAGEDETGKPWEPTWEPKENATRSLVEDWREKKMKDPTIVGIEGKRREEAIKAKRAEQRAEQRAKKRRRIYVVGKSKKNARTSKDRGASRDTGTGTPVAARDDQQQQIQSVEPPQAEASTKDTAQSPASAQSPTSTVNDVSVPMVDDGALEDGVTDPADVPDTPASPVEVEVEDVVDIEDEQSASGPSQVSPVAEEVDLPKETPASAADESQPAAKGDQPSSRAKRVRVNSNPVTIGSDQPQTGKAVDRSPETSKSNAEGQNVPATRSDQSSKATTSDTSHPDGADAIHDSAPAEDRHPPSPPSAVPAKAKDLAPVPVADAEKFRTFLPPSTQVGSGTDATQSTTSIGPSQLDPISQFSSPLRDSIEKGHKAKEVSARGPDRPASPVAPNVPEATNSKTTPIVVKRFVNGEEVMAVQSDSDETEDLSDEYEQARPQPEPLAEVASTAQEVDVVMAVPGASSKTKADDDNEGEPTKLAAEPEPSLATESDAPVETATASRAPSPLPETVGTADTESENANRSPSPDVIIHTTQIEVTSTSAGVARPDSNASDSQRDTRDQDVPVTEEQAFNKTLDNSDQIHRQAEELQSLRRLVAAKEVEIIKLSAKVSQARTIALAEISSPTPAPESSHPAPIRRPSPFKPHALASMRDTTLAEMPKSPLISQSWNNESVDDSATASDTDGDLITPAVAGTSTTRRTLNSSTPPTHLTSDQADFALRLAKKDNHVKTLKQKLQKSETDHSSTRQQLAFVQAQYQIASDSAVREVSRAVELEEELQRVRGQVAFGMKQCEKITAAVKAEHAKAMDKLKGQNKLLLDQNRATDDVVRSRAAAYKTLKSEIAQLREELRLEKVRTGKLSKRNDELLGQVELSRAREMGVLPAGGDDSDSDDSYSASDSDSDDSFSPPPRRSVRTIMVPKPEPGPEAAGPMTPMTAVVEPQEQPADPKPRTEVREGQAYPSPWTPGLFFPDEADVKDHIMSKIDELFV